MRNQPRRDGYTLLEIVLVCALIAIIAAATVPTTISSYDYYKLYGATDLVRGGWARARSHAIEESRQYRFAVVPGKGNFRIAPDDAAFWSGSPPTIDDDHPALIVEDALPKGIRFTLSGSTTSDDSGDSALPVDGVGSGQWTTIAVFDADGSAHDNVEVVFSMRGQQSLAAVLRGVTGTSTVRKIMRGKS